MEGIGALNQRLKDLPEETKTVLAEKNIELSKKFSVSPDDHPLLSKCWLTYGHSDQCHYFERISKLVAKLEKLPELQQLIRLAENCTDVKIVFDFKYSCINFIDPRIAKTSIGRFNLKTFLIVISAERKRKRNQACGTLIHEIGHLAMQMLYDNCGNPFTLGDIKRQQEFDEIVAECRAVSGEKGKIADMLNEFFRFYESHQFASELIVLVPKILCEWAGNYDDDIKEARKRCTKLFEFYFKYVVTDIDIALNNGPLIKQ